MREDQYLGIVDAAQGHTEKVTDAHADRHPHATDGTAQHDAFAVEFDIPYAAIGTRVMRVEANRQGMGVEPQCAARPGGSDPA
jgi:hypothetical protein